MTDDDLCVLQRLIELKFSHWPRRARRGRSGGMKRVTSPEDRTDLRYWNAPLLHVFSRFLFSILSVHNYWGVLKFINKPIIFVH